MDGFNVEKINSFSAFVDDIDYSKFYIVRFVHGKVSFTVNSKPYQLRKGGNFMIVDANQIVVSKESSDLELVVFSMTNSYFEELTILFDDQIFRVLWDYSPDMLSDSQMDISNSFLNQIYTIFNTGEYIYKKIIISKILQCYLLDIFEHAYENVVDEVIRNTNHRRFIMSRFYSTIMEYKVRDIEFYAKKLNLSSRNLYNITQASLRVTPKKVIDSTLLAVIKNMMLVSKYNNQQISEILNFSDQSAFCQYFKRCEGMTPSAYRKVNKV